MSKSTHATYLAIIAILSVAVIVLTIDGRMRSDQLADSDQNISSIAVLPFAALGSEASTSVAESITSRLIETFDSRPELQVAPKSSSRLFAETSLSISEIGERLSAWTILEGAVEETRDRLEVRVQLIDAGNDEHLWAETYNLESGALDGVVADIEQKIISLSRN